MGNIYELSAIRSFISRNFVCDLYVPYGVSLEDMTMAFYDVKDRDGYCCFSFYIDGCDVCSGTYARFFSNFLELAMILVALRVPMRHELLEVETPYGYFSELLRSDVSQWSDDI